MNLHKYLGVIKLGFKNQAAYRTEFILRLALFISIPLIIIAIWSAIYSYSGVTSLGGYSLQIMAEYLLFNTALLIFVFVDLTEDLADGIIQGSVAKFLIKPMGMLQQNIAFKLPELIISSIPLIIAIIALLVIGVHTGIISVYLAFACILLSFVMMQLIWLIINISAVYFTQVWGFYSVFWSISGPVGGELIPLSLMPYGLGGIFALLPFQFFFYLPTSLMLGTVTASYVISELPIGFIWLAALIIFAYAEWRHAIKRLNTVGV